MKKISLFCFCFWFLVFQFVFLTLHHRDDNLLCFPKNVSKSLTLFSHNQTHTMCFLSFIKKKKKEIQREQPNSIELSSTIRIFFFEFNATILHQFAFFFENLLTLLGVFGRHSIVLTTRKSLNISFGSTSSNVFLFPI